MMDRNSITSPPATPTDRPTTLVRWAAISAVTTPVLALFAIAVGFPLYTMEMREAASTSRLLVANGATLALLALLVLSLVGVYAAVQHRLRAAGHAGFVTALVGTTLAAGGAWDSLFALPYLADAAPRVLDEPTGGTLLAGFIVSYLVLVVGWSVFAVACLTARALPRAACMTMLAGALLAFVPAPTALRVLVLAVGVALAGRALRRPASDGES